MDESRAVSGDFSFLRQFFVLLLFSPSVFFSQTTAISGEVVDAATGTPVVDANVVLVGTELGDATDSHGEFLIPHVAPGIHRLLVSHVGYLETERMVSVPQSGGLIIQLRETFFQLDEVVVTGTRTEKIHKDVPIATEVVSKQDILDSGARDVAELLEERAGTFVNSSVAGGNILNLLGIDSNYILILVDGQPVAGKFNDRVSLDQFSTALVDKVEIIKGPSSSLYGSEAMGGVVNIITRSKLSLPQLSLYSRSTVSAGREMFRFLTRDFTYDGIRQNLGPRQDLRLNLKNTWRKLHYQLDLDFLKANVDQANQYISVDSYDKYSARGTTEWAPAKHHTLSLTLSHYSNGEDSHTRTLNAKTDILRNSLFLKHTFSGERAWRLETLVRKDDYMREHLQVRPWGERVSENHSTESQIEFEENAFFEDRRNTLNLGLEINGATFSSARVLGGRQHLVTRGLYFQWDRHISPQADAVIGLRLDHNDEVKLVRSPRLAWMVTLKERWKFRAAWGTGFRMPSFMDRYIDWNHLQFGYRIVGNPDLRPEVSQGYSLGVEYYEPGRYQMSLMVYRNQFKDMITDYLLEPGLFSYRNVERVRYTGIEVQNRWNISTNWLASWGYNYLDNRDLATGKLVPNTQPHSVSLRIGHTSGAGKLSGALKIKVVGPYYPEEYVPELGRYIRSDVRRHAFALVNVTSRIKLSRRLGLAFGVQNVGDYKDKNYGPFIGRTFYMELMTEFRGGN